MDLEKEYEKKFELEFPQYGATRDNMRALSERLKKLNFECGDFLPPGPDPDRFGNEKFLSEGDVEHQIAALRAADTWACKAIEQLDNIASRWGIPKDEIDEAETDRYMNALEDAMKLMREIRSELDFETLEVLHPALNLISEECWENGQVWLTKADLKAVYPTSYEFDPAEALKLMAAEKAEQIGEKPVKYARKIYKGMIPKAWIENNATVLREFPQPERESETLLYAVKETDPEALERGFTTQALVSTFDSQGEPSAPAIRFGYYFDEAYQYADPEIVEDACISWTRDDCAMALQGHGVEPDEKTIDEMIDRIHSKDGWKDVAVLFGNRLLDDVAGEIANKRVAEGRSSKAEAQVMEEEWQRASARK